MALTLIGSDSMVADGGVNTNLQSHTPSGSNALGSNWVHLQVSKPTLSIVVEAADNTACQPYGSSGNFYNAYVIGPSAAAIQKSQFTITSNAHGATYGLIVLAANAASLWNGYLGFYNSSNSLFTIRRYDSGVATTIGTPAAGTIASNDVLSLEVDGSGNFILRQNGTSVATATDTTYTTGKPGIALLESFTSGGINAYSAYQDAGGGFTAKSRRTFGPLGTRIGSRQVQGHG